MSAPHQPNRISHYLQLIWSAIRGDEHDYTTLSLRKAVVLLAIPMILELCMESVFAVTDIYFVNKLGVHAVSVVGLTESVITLIYSIGIGLSAAATAVVARRIGEKIRKPLPEPELNPSCWRLSFQLFWLFPEFFTLRPF